MKNPITLILAITLMAVPANVIAHEETWAEYDQRLEKQIAEVQDKLPMGIKEEDDSSPDMKITSIEKNGKIITTTLETKGKYGWLTIAEEMGGVEKFKALQQRMWARSALMIDGVKLARNYTLRYIYVDNGKKICTVDVSALIIMSMVNNGDYIPAPLEGEESYKYDEFEKYLEDGGYPPAGLTPEEIYKFREFFKYKKY